MPTWKPPFDPAAPIRQAIADWLRASLDDSVVSDQRAPARVKRAIMKVPATAVNKALPLFGFTETPQPLSVADIPSPATIMIGKGSPLFNREMAAKFAEVLRKIPLARRLERRVVQGLWDQFRTFMGPDNRLRQEISDEGLRVDTGFPNEEARYWRANGDPITVEHPELRRAYPGLMESLRFRNSRPDEDFGSAFYLMDSPRQSPRPRKLSQFRRNPAGEIVLERRYDPDLNAIKQVGQDYINQQQHMSMIHELQHAVQVAEGFAEGANPSDFWRLPAREQRAFRNKFIKPGDGYEDIEYYLRAPGEAEARLAQRRYLEPSPDIAPLLQYDYPLRGLHKRRR